MDHTAVLRTTRTTLCPITLPPAGQHDIPLPPELAESKELHHLWHVRRQDGQPLGWVWLHDANETLHDITLSFRAVSEDTDALLEAVLKARCTLAGDPPSAWSPPPPRTRSWWTACGAAASHWHAWTASASCWSTSCSPAAASLCIWGLPRCSPCCCIYCCTVG